MRVRLLHALPVVLIVPLWAMVSCQSAPDPNLLRTRLESAIPPDSRSDSLRKLYQSHGFGFLWSDAGGKLTPRAEVLLGWIRDAGRHGLNPDDYGIGELDSLHREITEREWWNRDSATRLVDFDLLASTALVRYASDLSNGRVQAGETQIDWRIDQAAIDVAKEVDDAVGRDDLGRLNESLPPRHPGYDNLRRALDALRAVEANGGWPAVTAGSKLKVGSRGPAVGQLRQRLLESSSQTSGDRFDARLEHAVRRFQTLHGLDADGVAGEKTLREMNVPVSERIRQVELNLERWRWMPRDLGDPYLLVNIPAFELQLVRDNDPAWKTRIVAGKAYTPTPVFSDRIVGVVVHPPWNVPDSIATNEYLPQLRKDRKALARQNLKLLQGAGDKAREIDSRDVDWSKVDADHFPYRIRQEPGPENPLGAVKFVMTNDFAVYLHDTPAKHTFSRSERDLSHGCIRVQHALELANQIADREAWTAIQDALDDPAEKLVNLRANVPVHIVYWTAWVDDAGDLHFGPDVYGFDGQQQAALDQRPGRSTWTARLAEQGPI